jgi:two-component system cell cycle response regulator
MSEKKLRVLVAEGNPGEIAPVLRALYPEAEDGLELTVVSSVSILIATLDVVNPEVIFLDLALTHPSPVDAVRRVQRSAPAIPLIVLAGGSASDKAIAVNSLSHGAQDYLLKGSVDSRNFERVLRTALERNTLEELADLLRDSLTGLYTRDGFLALGTRAMEMAKSRESTLVLLCLRIENLAAVRAGYGPSAAESSLCEVAKALAASFRRTDILARLGESQFAALAVDAAEPSASVLRQRLEKRIEMLDREIGPWGPLELGISARFWSAKEAIVFSEFLDSVESELRIPPATPSDETAERQTVSANKGH